MITREADYAIRVLLALAEAKEGEVMSTTVIAERMYIPYRFLRTIVRKLAKAGLVGATRGKAGGVFLLREASEISVYDALELFDPKALLFNSCYQEHDDCPRKGGCSVHVRMRPVQEKLERQLKDIKVSDLV